MLYENEQAVVPERGEKDSLVVVFFKITLNSIPEKVNFLMIVGY